MPVLAILGTIGVCSFLIKKYRNNSEKEEPLLPQESIEMEEKKARSLDNVSEAESWVAESRKIRILRYTMLAVGSIMMAFSYSINSYNIYANCIKQTFSYTQSQIDVIGGVGYLGQLMCLPSGIILEKIGPRKTTAIALVLSVGGYLLMWSTFANISFYQQHFYLFALYVFIGGCGGGVMFIVATSANMANFRPSKHATINSLLQGACSAGGIVVILIYEYCYVNGHHIDNINQDLEGFLLTMAIIFLGINILGIIVNDEYPPFRVSKTPMESMEIITKQKEYNTLTENYDSEENLDSEGYTVFENDDDYVMAEDKTGFKLLKDIFFHAIFWSYCILSAQQSVYLMNITVILKSFFLENYTLFVCIFSPVFGTISQPLLGFLADKYSHKTSRGAIIFIGAVVLGGSYVAAYFFGAEIIIIVYMLLIANVAGYIANCLHPPELVDYFGLKYFPRNNGLLCVGYSFTTFFLAIIFGVFYDLQIEEEGRTYCYGIQCYTNYYILLAVLSFAAAIFAIPLVPKFRKKSEKASPENSVTPQLETGK